VQDDPWSAAGVRPGALLADKYRVERILGLGGMGVVVAAWHVQLEERVAIKFLLPAMLGDAASVQRFLREAKACVRIKGEHVVRVFDVGTLANGAPYMVMEFLEGMDLSGFIAERGPLLVEEAVDFVLQACVALADAHRLGVVHRDLKPSNLFCVPRSDGQRTIKVLDFGISKVSDAAGSGAGLSMTKTSAVMGSPLYMSPEQMRSSKEVDSRTDIWALGVILFELLAARPPFDGTSLTEVAVKVATEPPPPLRSVRPDAPPGLEAAIARCLQKDPRARFPDVGQLAGALSEFASRRGRATAERVASIEVADRASADDLGVTSPASPELQARPLETVSAVGRTESGNTTGAATARRAALGGLLFVALAGAALIAGRLRTTARAPPSPPPPLSPAETESASPKAAASAAEAVGLAPAPAISSESDADVEPPPALPRQEAPRRPPASPARAPRTAPAHAEAPAMRSTPAVPRAPSLASCDPPYFIDGAGHRQYKPECL
jgi:serine/threonine-protein kinase